MLRNISISLLLGLILLAAMTTYANKGSIEISNDQLASTFFISYTAHGFPVHYQTSYSNTSGNYGSGVPTSTGVHYWELAADYGFWVLLSAICIVIVGVIKAKRQQTQIGNRKRTASRRENLRK